MRDKEYTHILNLNRFLFATVEVSSVLTTNNLCDQFCSPLLLTNTIFTVHVPAKNIRNMRVHFLHYILLRFIYTYSKDITKIGNLNMAHNNIVYHTGPRLHTHIFVEGSKKNLCFDPL